MVVCSVPIYLGASVDSAFLCVRMIAVAIGWKLCTLVYDVVYILWRTAGPLHLLDMYSLMKPCWYH